MKRAWAALLALPLVATASPCFADEASPPKLARNEPYVTSGFTYYGSDRRVVAGLGGGPGYRFHVTKLLALYTEARWIDYVGNAFTAALGASVEFPLGPLEPLVGLQGTLYGGDRVEVIDSLHPVPPAALAWAAQVRLAPLRFVHAPFTVTTLSGDVGFGIDSKTRALAVTISFLDIGVRF